MKLTHLLFLNALLFLLLPIPSSAQSAIIDSLTQKLNEELPKEERVDLLNSLSFAYYQKYTDQGISYANKALELALEINYSKGVANAHNSMGVNYWNRDEFAKALEHYDKALELYKELSLHEKTIRTTINKAVIFADQADYLKAIEHYKIALASIRKHNIEDLEPAVLNNMGIVFKEIGDYPNALENYLAFKNYAQRTKKKSWEFKAWQNAGDIYVRMKDYFAAMEAYQVALTLALETQNRTQQAMVIRNFGRVCRHKNKLDSAYIHFENALAIYNELNKKSGIAATLNDLGNLKLDRQDYPKALAYFQKALAIRQTSKRKSSIAILLNNIGRCHLGMGQLDSAEQYSLQAYTLAKEIQDVDKTLKSTETLAQIYEQQKAYTQALAFQKEYISLFDSTLNQAQVKKLNQLETKYHYEQREYKLKATQEKEVLIYEQRQLIMVIVGALLMLLAVILYGSYRRKQKDNTLLAKQSILLKEQAGELKQQNEELMTANTQLDHANQLLEQSKEKEKALMRATIESKEQQLTTIMMASFEKNGLIEQIEKKIKILEDEVSKEVKPKLKEIKRIVSANKQLDKDWDSFVHQFENIHPRFFEKLQQQHPNLSINDLKMCAYLKIGMQTKEIASITNVSPDASYKQLYRLKKKLDLPTDMTVREWVFRL